MKKIFVVVTKFGMLSDYQVLQAFYSQYDAEEFAQDKRDSLPPDEQDIEGADGFNPGRTFEVLPIMLKSDEQVQYVHGYMDGVAWQHEIGECSGGSLVFESQEDLEKHKKCTNECGIVKVKVSLLEWVRPQDFKWENATRGPVVKKDK